MPRFRERFAAVKRANKAGAGQARRRPARHHARSRRRCSTCQVKRIHEYKRQLLNILETIALYDDIRSQPDADWVPRVKIFAGKAAASYRSAKLIIKLINDVAQA